MIKRGSDPLQNASLIFMSSGEGPSELLERALRKDKFARFDIETEALSQLNGAALSLVEKHDILLFDVPEQDTDAELEIVKSLLQSRGDDAVAIALASEDLTLGQVRRIRESGFDEVLPRTTTQVALRDAMEEAYSRKIELAAAGGNQTNFITVARARGGLGATTLAVNLARSLVQPSNKRRGKPEVRVALLDLDIQFGDANVMLDLEDDGLMAQIIDGTMDGLIPQLAVHTSGVEFLSAPKDMVPLDALSKSNVTDLLNALRGRFDHVVIDLPRALVDWVTPVLEATDQLMVVTDISVQSIRQARRLRDVFREDNIALPITYVANHATAPMLRNAQISDAENVLESRIDHWIPDMPREMRKAADLGVPIIEQSPRNKASKAIAKLAKAVSTPPRPSVQKTIKG